MLLSNEELQKAATIHPEVVEAIKGMNMPPPDEKQSALEQIRSLMSMSEIESKKPTPTGLTEIYHEIIMRDGFASKIKIIKPIGRAPGPLIVLFFGGSFIAGSLEQLVGEARNLALLYGATVICPNYRLGPEYKFPTAQHDGWDTMKWAASNATSEILGADPQQGFIIGGVSAGGGMSAALTRQFQREPLAHPITGQWLCIASLMTKPENVPEKYKSKHISVDQCAEAPFLSRKNLGAYHSQVQADPSSPLRYAVHATTPIADQPRTYFQVSGLDPIRDDSLVYDEMLKEAGVETKLDLYYGVPHGFFSSHSFRGGKLYARANIDTYAGFGWLLRRNTDREELAKALELNEH